MKNFSFKIIIVLAVFLVLPNFVFALGQMSEPIVIENALRGEIIQEELTVINSDNTIISVEYSAEGDIKDWVKFYNTDNTSDAIATGTIPSQGTKHITVLLSIPSDIANGKYSGRLSVTNLPENNSLDTESQASVKQKIDREVTITISDKEDVNINGTSVIPESYNLKPGDPLNIRVIYDNQGNIKVSPQIRVKIIKNEKSVYDMIYPFPEDETAVKSNSQQETKPLSIQTVGWENGTYQVQLVFSRGEEKLMEKSFQIKLNEKSPSFVFGITNSLKTNLVWFVIIIIGIAAAFMTKMLNRKNV